MIERAEQAIAEMGFRVRRVRHFDGHARVEIGKDELDRALDPEVSESIVRELKEIGYADVVIDPRGYRTGSLNEGLRLRVF
jgi:uncharacterized protein